MTRAVLVALLAAGCVRRVVVSGPPAPCLTQPPPVVALAPRVRDGCPDGLVCLTDDGARETAHAVEEARGWMARAWAGCQGASSR